MSKFAVIVENDESQWSDVKGQSYHFPRRYLRILQPGCKVIYYKGGLTKRKFSKSRLSDKQHYFGVATIGESVRDKSGSGNNYFCEILEYQEFKEAVIFKKGDRYLEDIPKSKESNYFRDGVREISKDVYKRILDLADLDEPVSNIPSLSGEFESEDGLEGGKKSRYSTYYERSPVIRQRALDIHGYQCKACFMEFEKMYGSLGREFIHVHHKKPLSETGLTKIDPENDLTVLCPNCHAMVHRKKDQTLTVEELKEIIAQNRNAKKGLSLKE